MGTLGTCDPRWVRRLEHEAHRGLCDPDKQERIRTERHAIGEYLMQPSLSQASRANASRIKWHRFGIVLMRACAHPPSPSPARFEIVVLRGCARRWVCEVTRHALSKARTATTDISVKSESKLISRFRFAILTCQLHTRKYYCTLRYASD